MVSRGIQVDLLSRFPKKYPQYKSHSKINPEDALLILYTVLEDYLQVGIFQIGAQVSNQRLKNNVWDFCFQFAESSRRQGFQNICCCLSPVREKSRLKPEHLEEIKDYFVYFLKFV